MRGVATKGKGARLAYALEHTPAIVERLETYFGIPYPYPKLDLIASAQMTGAMENAGAILFNETLLLLDDAARPTQLRSFFETMAHELAHHWFGDLVTPAWWDDIWLNESFAEWMGVKIADGLRPDLGSRAGLVDSATYAMDVDSKRSGRPIHQPVSDNAQIASTFDSITYVKGGQARKVTAGHAVLACWNSIIPYLCPELPAPQREALAYGIKAPIVYTNVPPRGATSKQARRLEGEFRPGGSGREWCAPDVLTTLRRRSLARLRKEVEPAEPEALARLLLDWQGVTAASPRRAQWAGGGPSSSQSTMRSMGAQSSVRRMSWGSNRTG